MSTKYVMRPLKAFTNIMSRRPPIGLERSSVASASARVAKSGIFMPEHWPRKVRNFYYPIPEGRRDSFYALSDYQRSALGMVREQAEGASEVSMKALLVKFKRLKLTASDLDLVLNYFATTCEMTINFEVEREVPTEDNLSLEELRMLSQKPPQKVDVVAGLIEKGGFFSQFETGISGGIFGPSHDSRRDIIEYTVFNGAYYGHDGKVFPFPHQRPVYGAFNFLKNPNGGCEVYGPAFATLKNEIRNRTTLTYGDSISSEFEEMGTPDHMAHVILSILPDCLLRLVKVVKGGTLSDEELLEMNRIIEFQIHGGVSLSDLSSISFPSDWLRDPKNQQKIQTLKETYGLTINSL